MNTYIPTSSFTPLLIINLLPHITNFLLNLSLKNSTFGSPCHPVLSFNCRLFLPQSCLIFPYSYFFWITLFLTILRLCLILFAHSITHFLIFDQYFKKQASFSSLIWDRKSTKCITSFPNYLFSKEVSFSRENSTN